MTKSDQPLVPVQVEDIRLLLEAGYLYYHMNRLEEAREVFEGIIPLAPKSELPHIALAVLHFGQGRHEEAERAFKAGVELKPDSAFALANYGDFLHFHHRIAEAMSALNRAIELDPNGPNGRLARSLIEAYQEAKP
jgi:Tfp pilus assembly protein PilF